MLISRIDHRTNEDENENSNTGKTEQNNLLDETLFFSSSIHCNVKARCSRAKHAKY